MILDKKLNPDEVKILRERFNKFREDLNEFIRSSNLFIEHEKIKGHFYSKTIYEGKFDNYNYKEHSLEIESDEYLDFILHPKLGWNSFNIRVIHVQEVKKIISFFGNKEELNVKYYHFFPMFLEDVYNTEYKSRQNYTEFKNEYEKKILITNEESNILNIIFEKLYNLIKEVKKDNQIRLVELSNRKNSLIKDLDNDSNGEVDLVDGESFNRLLTKNQKIIIEIDKNYIQKFVKISMYLKTKKSNTQKIFDSIKDTKNDTELNELVNLLKNQIHTYELLVFHSINMITSLVESDLITFYEIYECFDQLGVFNSNWENEVSDKLTDIGDGIRDLMYSIYQMENKIVKSIDNLTYTTQESFMDLTNSVEKQLSSIDSSIKFNNLLTGIQTYQMYKINQNTKGIN